MKNHSLGLVVLTIAAAMACGCAAPARPHAAAPLTAPTLVGDLQSTMEEHADAQLQLKGDATLYVLVLSGGGANGAWGAGVLNGWNDGGDVPNEGPIPKWDAVTGISTGALQGTAALLGNYKLLEKFYTTVKTSDVVTANFFGNQLLAAIFCSSIYDSSPLRKLLATVINDDIIDQVAEQATAGRKFYDPMCYTTVTGTSSSPRRRCQPSSRGSPSITTRTSTAAPGPNCSFSNGS
jgi:hypothetical protein